jgi:DNA gyrase subunit A
VCDVNQHVLLASKKGKALRCLVEAVRVFKGRNSIGVRGMKLAADDEVISMTILNSAEIDMETRTALLKVPVQVRRKIYKSEEGEDIAPLLEGVETELSKEEIEKYSRAEEMLLTATKNGRGKRSSAYEYRVTNRGGKGIVNIVTNEKNGDVVASFPVESSDQIMLITDRGKLIRCPVTDIRIAGRNTQGVMLFRIGDGESVVSAAHIADSGEDEDVELGGEEAEEGAIVSDEAAEDVTDAADDADIEDETPEA